VAVNKTATPLYLHIPKIAQQWSNVIYNQ
jgi:hypothetical protein